MVAEVRFGPLDHPVAPGWAAVKGAVGGEASLDRRARQVLPNSLQENRKKMQNFCGFESKFSAHHLKFSLIFEKVLQFCSG